MNLPHKRDNRLTHRLWKQTNDYQRGEEGINWDLGINTYTLLYIEYKINKDILHSTNYTQNSIITKQEKDLKKNRYMYNWITWLFTWN